MTNLPKTLQDKIEEIVKDYCATPYKMCPVYRLDKQQDVSKAIAEYIEGCLPKEICICAAVLTEDGNVVRGHRHGDCFYTINRMGKKIKGKANAQGFITSKNRYVTREEGRKLQNAAGIKSVWTDGYVADTLFSEDLY